MSGAFGSELTEAMHMMLQVMTPSHTMIAAELDNLWIDHDIDPDDAIKDPMKLVWAAPCFDHAATWVLCGQK